MGRLAPYPQSEAIVTKWMSADGRTLYLTFSGDDNFCVRKATLEVAETG